MVKTTIRLPEKLYMELKAMAKARGMTLNAYVLNVLWERKTEQSRAEEKTMTLSIKR